ncbi:3'-5' exoribonuclease 1-like [Glandiceps talaboti]
MARPPFYLCLDLEATCYDAKYSSQPVPVGFQPEITDIGAVILDSHTLEKKGEFQSYCRPVKHPNLSLFCQQLTKISQETVDKADEFPVVWGRFIAWLETEGLAPASPTPKFQLVTDGPFDCGRYLFIQFSKISKLAFPNFARHFIELKNEYRLYMGSRQNRRYPKLYEMMFGLGTSLDQLPTLHRALSDAKCVAYIFTILLRYRGQQYVPRLTAMTPYSAAY